jgi:hypothetical protein
MTVVHRGWELLAQAIEVPGSARPGEVPQVVTKGPCEFAVGLRVMDGRRDEGHPQTLAEGPQHSSPEMPAVVKQERRRDDLPLPYRRDHGPQGDLDRLRQQEITEDVGARVVIV